MPVAKLNDAFVRNVKLPKADGKRQITYLHNLERGLAEVRRDPTSCVSIKNADDRELCRQRAGTR